MRNRKIDTGIQTRILKYLEYIHKKDTMGSEKGDKIL